MRVPLSFSIRSAVYSAVLFHSQSICSTIQRFKLGVIRIVELNMQERSSLEKRYLGPFAFFMSAIKDLQRYSSILLNPMKIEAT